MFQASKELVWRKPGAGRKELALEDKLPNRTTFPFASTACILKISCFISYLFLVQPVVALLQSFVYIQHTVIQDAAHHHARPHDICRYSSPRSDLREFVDNPATPQSV